MTDAQRLFETHVAFELARWTGDRIDETVHQHVAAVLGWWDQTLVRDVAPAETVARAAGRLVSDLVLTDELVAVVAEIAVAGHAALVEHDGVVGDLVPPDAYDALVTLLAGQESARREVIEALTASKAYSRLVSHVLYQGLKGYLLTENVLARKVPGASSLVRLGQRGLNSAAPRLEAGVDRRLTSFVQANLSETLKESQRYLLATLDAAMLEEMAEEAWEAVVDRPLGEVVGVVEPRDTGAMVVAFAPVLRQWRDEGLLAEVAEAVIRQELERHGDRAVGELLTSCGVDTDRLLRDVLDLLRPLMEHARASGFLESRIRAELAPFYDALPQLLESPAPPPRKTAKVAKAVKKPAARSPRSRQHP